MSLRMETDMRWPFTCLAILWKIHERLTAMSAELDRLTASVVRLEAAEAALSAKVTELAQNQPPIGDDPASLAALADRLDVLSNDAEAKVANP